MTLDEAVITKLALFERCTDETAFTALLDLINSADGGKPRLLEMAFSPSTTLPEALEKHRSFVEGWLAMDPSLAGINLKPAIYLARDTMPLQLQSKTLSAASKTAVQELLKVATLSSLAAKAHIVDFH
ncbi:hypothetical protein J2S28_005370 [Rhizobium sp. SLBN-94]|jgi:hypothetical protein|nr:hypothetical protein [Rhizobium sp. SLBN-94]